MSLAPSQGSPLDSAAPVPAQNRIIGDGEMADRIRAFDWSSTPLGPIEKWSKELLTVVNLTLSFSSPARIMWGHNLILIYNDAYRVVPGPRHPAALGRPAKDVYGESWSVVGPLLETAITTGKTFFYEKLRVPLPSADGMRDHYLNYSFNPIFEDGRIAGLFGPLHDVTNEVTATQNLRESEERLARILQSIGDGVIVTDAEARVLRMNPVAESLTGWPLTEAIGHPLAEVFRIVSEETRQPVESPAAKVRRLGNVVGLANHTVLQAKDGGETNIDDSGAPVFDDAGNLTGIVLVFRDINERREAERERDSVSQRLNQVLNATTDAIVTVSRDWTMKFTNPKAAELYGDVVGKNVWETFPGAVYEGSPYTEHYYRAMNEKIPGDFEAYLPDPLNAWLHIMVYPTEDGIVTFSRDISSRKRSEAALIQSEKLAAMGRLASSIAHEINNPLESVTNLLFLARRSEDVSQSRSYLETADNELRRVAAITSQTLRFHRQATGPVLISAADLYSSVLLIYRGRIQNSLVIVERRDRSTAQIRCFEGEMRQVLSNLIGNAIDAMQRKGGRLMLRSRDATDGKTGRSGVLFTIADTGAGMDQRTMHRIFDAFFTTKEDAGTGLGLWVSKGIVERHQGRFRVHSSREAGKSGSVFSLFIPVDAIPG